MTEKSAWDRHVENTIADAGGHLPGNASLEAHARRANAIANQRNRPSGVSSGRSGFAPGGKAILVVLAVIAAAIFWPHNKTPSTSTGVTPPEPHTKERIPYTPAGPDQPLLPEPTKEPTAQFANTVRSTVLTECLTDDCVVLAMIGPGTTLWLTGRVDQDWLAADYTEDGTTHHGFVRAQDVGLHPRAKLPQAAAPPPVASQPTPPPAMVEPERASHPVANPTSVPPESTPEAKKQEWKPKPGRQ
jgi:hypothetical protein